MFCLHVCVCSMYMPGALASQKRLSDSPKLELSMVVSCHMGVKNQTGHSARTANALDYSAISLAYQCICFKSANITKPSVLICL